MVNFYRTMACRLLAALALAAAPAVASAQEGGPVRVALALAGGKRVFKAGEPVRLALSFTAERAGYNVDVTTTKPPHVIDTVLLAPEAGVFAWAEQYAGGKGYHPDHATMQQLSEKPVVVELALNDWYRFDRPGRYTVRVATGRVAGLTDGGGAPLRLLTNEVAFEIAEMSEAEEEAEVKRLSALLNAAKGWQEEARLSEELSYLSGPPATREKVRRYLAGGKTGNYSQNIFLGLVMARDRALAVRLLEAALRDTEKLPTSGLLNAAITLRMMMEGIPRPPMTMVFSPAGHPRAAELTREYVAELAASLPKRKGESRRAAAMTALLTFPPDAAGGAQAPAAVREVLVGEFDALHPYSQEYLLRVYWEHLRDPALLPAVERMLANNRGQQNYQVRTAALRRLTELSPERLKPYVVAELRDPTSVVDYEVLAALDDETLPEADDALLAQIKTFGPQQRNYDSVMLRHKAMLVARYGSPAIYDALMEVYRAWGERWQVDARGAILGYFSRYNETQALPLVEQAVARIQNGMDSTFLLELTRVSYPAGVRELLRRRLESDDPAAAGAAAYVMSRHGSEADAPLVAARLERWRKEWGGRAAELNSDAGGGLPQQMAEINLVEALLSAKVWKLTEEQAGRVRRGCVTERCRHDYGAK